ncbi:hypothetical protein GJ744_009856 [Endocarpon pusillum]|uniref:Meiotically up-regulated protein Msb1/Mug8 domain-containing protein n=1 Tax=Endocarpon pusillum TaxID=364733 RepID=A0A8H7AH23_9EURO|nr:hypothetical protein GJ744_009856 [Endocarpon pusillum]
MATIEKHHALDLPFILLPFRPTSDPSAARAFVRNYFFPPADREVLKGESLTRELRLIEPMVLASVMKWCWSRLPGGVVTWETYELFRIGEKDSALARDAFATFIPMSVDCEARRQIVFDFFDLMAALAAHGKTNGLGGRKLSRYAGWWAFEHYDTGKGFNAGYRGWASAADAASHLFFAYLRSLYPDPAKGPKGIIGLPTSLQQLVQATEYPPEAPTLMFNEATKVVMVVNSVSPTPYALLRRTKNFEYRDDDSALQQFSNYDDPVQALTEECRRVLRYISSTNHSTISTSKASTSLRDASWSRFEDVGFGAPVVESDGDDDGEGSMLGLKGQPESLRRRALSQNWDMGRPTTPSWADFLSTGFPDENGDNAASSMLLPPDKVLPPIHTTPRGQSSQSHRRNMNPEPDLEPGELARIDKIALDDSFWWVWISSLAVEEPTSRKAVFGRCALIETVIRGGKWMIMEEQVKGAAPEPPPGAYIARKKGFLGFTTKRGRLTRISTPKMRAPLSDPYVDADSIGPISRTNITPDQHAKIQAAAVKLYRRNQEQDGLTNGPRRGRQEDDSNKTDSVFTLQPMLMKEATQAMQWASLYDKKDIMAQYLGSDQAGRGSTPDLPSTPAANGSTADHSAMTLAEPPKRDELPTPPKRISLASSPTPNSKYIPLATLQAPAPPKDVSLPKTSSPPPAQDSLLPLLPSPPPSTIVKQKPVPAPSTEVTEATTAASGEPAVTSLPRPSRPVATDRQTPQPQPAVLRKAVPSSPEMKAGKRRQAGPGIKGMFGSRRVTEASFTPPVSPPIENGPAVAAARAALASKSKPQPNGQSVHQAITQAHNETPSPAHSRSQRPLTPPSEPAYEAPNTPPASDHVPSVTAVPHSDDGPKMPYAAEGENLSRADTNGRGQAHPELSTFDQGPLIEQPAFIPPESPVRSEPITPATEEPSQQIPCAFASQTEKDEAGEAKDLTRQISPVQDRWAQIRKNAAERAARQLEEQSRQSELKTDDGGISGEETIESRVARIKARVAELTGTMEASRR